MPQLNIRISDDLAKALEVHAQETGVPKTRIVRRAIEDILKKGYPRGNPKQEAKRALGIEDEGIASESPPTSTEGRADEVTPSSSEEKDSTLRTDAPSDPQTHIFKCPTPECDFTAPSPAAVCPAHGRKVRGGGGVDG